MLFSLRAVSRDHNGLLQNAPGLFWMEVLGLGNHPCPLLCLDVQQLPMARPAGDALSVQWWVQTPKSQLVLELLGHLGPKGAPEGSGEHKVLVKNPWLKL